MTRGHAVVIGASMAGLLAARTLAESFARVTVLDRDTLPEKAVHRRGVPQDRHVHAVQPRGLRQLEELLSGLTAELVDAGAVPGTMRFHLAGHLISPTGGGPSALTRAGRATGPTEPSTVSPSLVITVPRCRAGRGECSRDS